MFTGRQPRVRAGLAQCPQCLRLLLRLKLTRLPGTEQGGGSAQGRNRPKPSTQSVRVGRGGAVKAQYGQCRAKLSPHLVE